MRRITMWLTATLAVVAMITYYQVSLSGDGKEAEGARSVAAECGSPRAATETPAATAESADTQETAPATTAPAETEDKSSDPCAASEHTGKPGESK